MGCSDAAHGFASPGVMHLWIIVIGAPFLFVYLFLTSVARVVTGYFVSRLSAVHSLDFSQLSFGK